MEQKNNLENIDQLFKELQSKDNKIRFNAFQSLMQTTASTVDWVYDKWFELIEKLESKNSFHRSIGLQLLANLSKSDIDNWMHEVLENYLEFFNDEKFITSRQCIQNVWKIAISNKSCTKKIIEELESTYYENAHINKHGNLIKQDVVSSMFQIYKHTNDIEVMKKTKGLIESELDVKLIKSLEQIIKEKTN